MRYVASYVVHFPGRCRAQIGGLYKSLFTGSGFPSLHDRSGPLGIPWSCNNTLTIQSFQRITSTFGRPQNYKAIMHQKEHVGGHSPFILESRPTAG